MRRQQRWMTLAAGIAAVFLARGPVPGDEKIVPRPTVANPARADDEKAIRAVAAAFTKAFNAADVKALAALFAPDADYVDDQGQEHRGREAIAKAFALAFARQKGMTVELTIDAIRFLGKDAALEDGVARVKLSSGERGNVVRFTTAYSRHDGKWLMESVRESPYVPACNYEYLSELEWLVGRWTAKTGNASIEMKCDWTASRNFLLRTATVKQGSNTLSTSTQVIGWDPTVAQVRSWTFDSDGGFGSELWTKDGKQWHLEATGVRRDGSRIEATNLLTREEADTFLWQSKGRHLDAVKLPDTAAVKFVRAKAKP